MRFTTGILFIFGFHIIILNVLISLVWLDRHHLHRHDVNISLFVNALAITNKNQKKYNFDQRSITRKKHECEYDMDRRQALKQVANVGTAGFITGNINGVPISSASDETITISTTASISPITILSDPQKSQFPLVSFGLQIYDDNTAYKLTKIALDCGYRNFFASVLAGNQKGFAKAIQDSNIPREELYICGSVVSNRVTGFDNAYTETTKGWKRNLDAFRVGGIDYLDQIMLDYPGPDCDSIRGQWKSFEDMYQQGYTKSLSVSNFSPTQLDCVLKAATAAKPVVNQLPYSVAYHPGNVVEENKKRGILVQAWAPLGGSLGGRFNSNIKGVCAQIGEKYNKSFAQVALRWIIQTGASFTTQSKNKDHFKDNLDIYDFELTPEEMAILSSLA